MSEVEVEHGLYLLHFDPPYRHARHYLGYADAIPRRVHEHFDVPSKASPLVRAALAAGCRVQLSAVWLGLGRTDERRRKRGGGHARHCPTCALRGLVPASRTLTIQAGRATRRAEPV